MSTSVTLPSLWLFVWLTALVLLRKLLSWFMHKYVRRRRIYWIYNRFLNFGYREGNQVCLILNMNSQTNVNYLYIFFDLLMQKQKSKQKRLQINFHEKNEYSSYIFLYYLLSISKVLSQANEIWKNSLFFICQTKNLKPIYLCFYATCREVAEEIKNNNFYKRYN